MSETFHAAGPNRSKRWLNYGLRYLVALFAIFFALFPVVWIISAAFNPNGSLSGQNLIPERVSLGNFSALLNDPLHPFLRWALNSIKVSSITAILAVFITALSAYAFSRFRFKGRRGLLVSILLVQVFPNTLTMVALYLIMQQIGTYVPFLGLDSHGGLILVYLGGQMGINIWLMKGFFDSVPRDLDESALVDGATHWQVFSYLILPLVRPILIVVGILIFIGTFGDFVLARVLIKDTQQFTLMMGLYLFVSDQFNSHWGVFAAGALLGGIPFVVLYLLLQDQIISGLTQGAVKG